MAWITRRSGPVLLPVILVTSGLVACGGGGSSNNGGDDSGVAPAISASAEIQVSGLDGEVVVGFGDETTRIAADGSVNLADVVTVGDDVTFTLVSEPDDQVCVISNNVFTDVDGDITGVAVTCEDASLVTATVRNYFSGEVIAGASVSGAIRVEGGADRAIPAVVTDANGVAHLKGALPATGMQSVVLTADADGYGEFSAPLANGASSGDIVLQLQPANIKTSFSATEAASLTLVSGATVVSLPASSLVDASGNTVTGTVNSEVTLIDPSRDPGLMPGGFVTTNDPDSGLLESFGAMNITFRNEAGELLNLAEGQQATIRIPVAEGSSDLPETMPLYYFNTDTGLWVEEGEATLVTEDGASFYVGSVAHFSTWNADMVYDTIQVEGCVQGQNEVPLADVRVTSQGRDYVGSSSTYSRADGTFTLSVRRDSDVLLQASLNGLYDAASLHTGSSNIELSSCLVLEQAAMSITLTWGENPGDLDSHFGGYTNNEGYGENSRFHVYYSNREVTYADQQIELDVDDVTSFGPEVVTVSEFTVPGEYEYAVYHYSGSGDIQQSPARVELQVGGQTQVFSPPAGDPSTCWAVFRFTVDDNLQVTVQPTGRWEPRNYCDYVGSPEADAAAVRMMSTADETAAAGERRHPLTDDIENKYYAR